MGKKIGCLVMAAGNGSRFEGNKLEAEVDGKSLILRTLEAIPKELFSQVTVVTQYNRILELAAEFGFEAIKNAHPDWGISHTIFLGTKAMADCDGIMYLVSDQPLLQPDSLRRVVEAWLEHPDCICGAAHNGKRGNPNIFPKDLFPQLMALEEDHGGNYVIRAHSDRLRTVEIPPMELTDVDTRQALEDLKSS